MDIGATNPTTLQLPIADPAGGGAANDRSIAVRAVRSINQSGLLPGRQLLFHIDPTTHGLTFQVVNSDTGQVLDQIPLEAVLKLAAELDGKNATAETP
jgi:hypothetical protein